MYFELRVFDICVPDTACAHGLKESLLLMYFELRVLTSVFLQLQRLLKPACVCVSELGRSSVTMDELIQLLKQLGPQDESIQTATTWERACQNVAWKIDMGGLHAKHGPKLVSALRKKKKLKGLLTELFPELAVRFGTQSQPPAQATSAAHVQVPPTPPPAQVAPAGHAQAPTAGSPLLSSPPSAAAPVIPDEKVVPPPPPHIPTVDETGYFSWLAGDDGDAPRNRTRPLWDDWEHEVDEEAVRQWRQNNINKQRLPPTDSNEAAPPEPKRPRSA